MTFKHTFDWKLLYIANNSNMKLKPVIMTLKIQMYIAESCFWSARLNFLATAKSSGDLSCLISARGWLSCRFNVLYCGLYRNTYILWLLPLALTFPNLELYILLKIQKIYSHGAIDPYFPQKRAIKPTATGWLRGLSWESGKAPLRSSQEQSF